jgi:hypothetical protein
MPWDRSPAASGEASDASRDPRAHEPATFVEPPPRDDHVIVGEEPSLALAPLTDQLGGGTRVLGLLVDRYPMRGGEQLKIMSLEIPVAADANRGSPTTSLSSFGSS